MARKDNTPDKMDTEKETGTKRRYQSPQTPPEAPRSRQGREQASQPDGQDRELGREQDRRGDQQDRRGDQQDRQDDTRSEQAFGADSPANAGTDFDLQKASRDELDAIAQELNIDEYDTMTREELVIEIRERS